MYANSSLFNNYLSTHFRSANGEIYTWGEGNYGQLGLGENHLQCNTPKKVSKPIETVEMAQIACGSNHTAAITSNPFIFLLLSFI